jgi:hypothetical protein
MNRTRDRFTLWLASSAPFAAAVVLVFLLAGCSEPEEVPSEPRRADDKITTGELDSFLSIMEVLPNKALPQIPSVMAAAPQWTNNRTLPVLELVKEEEKLRFDHGSIDWLAAHCPQSRALKRALQREKMTIRQFIGLYLALGAALSRDHVPADRDVEQILERGRLAIAQLKKDQRIFSSLPDDEAYFLREKSGWLAVVDRAARLKLVHPDNLALVAGHRDRLAAVMPEEFKSNPFLEFTTILDDRGVPFQEPLGRENDDHLSWSRDRALVGSDRPGEAEVP